MTPQDVDFSDITFANSTAPGTPFTGTRLGDAKGNSGDITFTTPANKYYVGNTANWNGTVWALTTGGSANANNFPLPQDTAIFDANSFSANSQTLTVNGSYRMPGVDFSGMTNRTGITFATGSTTPTLYGDLKLSTAGTFAVSGTGILTFSGRNTQTVTSQGISWTQPWTIDSLGGTVTLGDNNTLGSTLSTTLTRGTLDLNGKTLSTGLFDTNNSNTRAIKSSAPNGKLATTATSASTTFTAHTSTGLTVDLATATWSIEAGGNTTNIRNFAGGNKVWPALSFTNTTANGELDIYDSNTFTSIAVSTPPQSIKFGAGTTTTIVANDGFPSGTSGNLVTITSRTAGTHALAKSGGGVVSCDYLSISWSTATPGTTWYAGPLAHSTDGGNNSGWTFTAAPAHYTLTVAYGAFALTGENAGLLAARTLPAGQGTFTLTGEPAGLTVARKLSVANGSFTMTGEDAGLFLGHRLTVGQGAFTFTGESAGLYHGRLLTAGQGAFTLTGEDVAFSRTYRLPAGQGSFTLTGESIGLRAARLISSGTGYFFLNRLMHHDPSKPLSAHGAGTGLTPHAAGSSIKRHV